MPRSQGFDFDISKSCDILQLGRSVGMEYRLSCVNGLLFVCSFRDCLVALHGPSRLVVRRFEPLCFDSCLS